MITAANETEDAVATQSLTERVVTAVAAEQDTDPLELGRLADVIDPEALTELFGDTHSGASRSTGQVVFEYEGCTVTVDGNGGVAVSATE